MEQSEPASPRSLSAERNALSFYGSAIAAEMSGCCDLGMKCEALQLVRKILTQERILPEEFREAVRTIGVHADKLKTWKPKLEAAYNRQSRAFKSKVRSDVLSIYASMNDWDNARRFVSVREAWSADEIMFSMDALLALDLLDDAKRLSRRCMKVLPFARTRFEQSLLIEALASFFARTRDWDKAIALWENTPMEEPFRRNALEGIIRIHLARAFEAAERGLQIIRELKQHPHDKLELSLPGNELGMFRDDEKALLKFKQGIEKLLPGKARKNLGISNENT
jgi:hypothetical protein